MSPPPPDREEFEPGRFAEDGGEIDWRLIRFLGRHCATGIAAGLSTLLGLVWSDVGQIGSLMARSDVGWLGYLMLAAGFGLTGGSVGMGIAVMGLGDWRDR